MDPLRRPRLKLNIEKLVVEGSGISPRSLEAAIHEELARLVAERGLPSTGGVDGAWRPDHRVTIKPGASAAELGAQIARAIHGGIGGQAPGGR